jgi:hypothetical protein
MLWSVGGILAARKRPAKLTDQTGRGASEHVDTTGLPRSKVGALAEAAVLKIGGEALKWSKPWIWQSFKLL